jgi:undecaprenyl-diphosphatase
MEASLTSLPDSLKRRLDPNERYGLRVTLFAVAIVLVTVPFATLVFQVIVKGPVTTLDSSVANHLNDWVHNSPTVLRVLDVITNIGKPITLFVIVTAAVAYLLWRRRIRLALYLVVTSVVGGLIDTAVKILVNRPRPVVDHPIATALGKSFPSGHAMSATVTYGALALVFLPVLPRRWRPVALGFVVLLVLAIGSSRLFLGVHFVSDVIGGFVLGLAWLAASTAAFSIWRTEEGKKPVEVTQGVEPEAAPALRGEE